MGKFSDFQRAQVVCARLAGASVTIGVSRVVVSKVMTTHKPWEDIIS